MTALAKPHHPKRKRKLSDERFLELHASGLSCTDIAAHEGLNRGTVRRVGVVLGVYELSRPHGATAPEIEQRILELLSEGLPCTWIAEEVGLHQSTVSIIRRRAGFDDSEPTEWRRAWSRIRTNPALFALHQEFAPRKGRRDE